MMVVVMVMRVMSYGAKDRTRKNDQEQCCSKELLHGPNLARTALAGREKKSWASRMERAATRAAQVRNQA